MAKAGFYYYNHSDRVCCAWCHGVISKWEVGDNPFTEHQRFFPNCPRVQFGPNIEIASDGIRDLGIQPIRAPKEEKYSCLDARIRTFSSWPRPDIQDPEVLATAGFYFQGIDDQVRCFHCNGGLRTWQKEDDAWFEHAKWFPQCQFVQLVKGDQYVKSVQQLIRPTLDDAMTSQPVQQALQMGLHEGRVRAAMKKHLEKFGRPYTSIDALVEAVLDSQHDEEDDEEDDEDNQSSSTIVREVTRIIDTILNPRASSSTLSEITENVQDITHDERAIPISQSISTTSTMTTPATTTTAATMTIDRSSSSSSASSSVPKATRGNESKDPTVTTTSKPSNDEHPQQMSLEEENRKLKDARLCKICMVDEVGVVFLPCGHLGDTYYFLVKIKFNLIFVSSYMLSMCSRCISMSTMSQLYQSVCSHIPIVKEEVINKFTTFAP